MDSLLKKMEEKKKISPVELKELLEYLLDPDINEEEIKSILLAFTQLKLDESLLTAAAQVMRNHALQVKLNVEAIDTCGTGGDASGSFNFSTASALLVAACGVPVAKHGNRAISSKSGSADLLEALGIPIDMEAPAVMHALQKHHFAFMLAPKFHPAMAKVQKVRRQLKVVTLFNYLGPLLNPARVSRQIIGVSKNELRPLFAQTLQNLGLQKAWVVWGEGGMDEMTLAGKTYISEVTPDAIREIVVSPEEVTLRSCELKDLKGGDATTNAKLLQAIFERRFFGPLVTSILYNAAAALVVAGQANDMREGLQQAKLALQEGKAAEKLEELKVK